MIVEGNKTEEIVLYENSLDLHDILFFDGSLYLVSAKNNEVICFDKNFSIVDRWGLPGEPDSVHINSISFYQGKLIAAIFGRFETSRGYKAGTRGLGQVIDIQTGEIIIAGLSQPHSLTGVGDFLYLCNSETMELRIYRGSTLTLEKKVPLPGYTRGIAVGDKQIYVGISLSRNINYEGSDLSASIAIVDKNSLEHIDTLQVPFLEVYDICIVENQIPIPIDPGQKSLCL